MKQSFILLAYLILSTAKVVAQNEEDELYNLLQDGKYTQLVNKVCSLREKEYYKNAFMDYCLAYGYCKLNFPALSGEWFDHLLSSYNNLSQTKRTELLELRKSCTNLTGPSNSTAKLFDFLRSMSSEGFQGNSTGIESKMGIPSLTDTIKEFDFEHLTFDTQNRKFTQDQKKEAFSYYKVFIDSSRFKADTTAHFLVFYTRGTNSIENDKSQLEKYYLYYSSVFDLEQSNRLIIIFYCKDRSDFNKVAEKVHKIPVPNSTFGYASSIDLVMMGIANEFWLGAMKHELFHLMIRSYIGDIPPWLDEGTACLFESSNVNGNAITPVFSSYNYRVRLLSHMDEIKSEISHRQNKPFLVPGIDTLTNYNWQQFSGITGELMMKASFNQAFSYAFVSYLNEKNLLEIMMANFRHRSYKESITQDQGDDLIKLHVRTNDELIRKVTGKTMSQVQKDFAAWCKAKYIELY